MTVTIDTSILDAIEAAPIPYNLYGEVHKGLRHALFALTEAAGSLDAADAEARTDLAARVTATVELFHSHHAHEDDFVKPLLDEAAPELSSIVDAGHEVIDQLLDGLGRRAAELEQSTGADAVVASLSLYYELATFTARYLDHMAFEEGDVMTALRSAVTTAELFELDMALRQSIDPVTMCRFITIMAPAANPDELTAMLGGMKAGAPAEIFELFRSTAEAALAPDAYAVVAGRIGLA
jgi:hypothetical protein